MKKLLMSGIAALMLGGCYKDIKTEEKPSCNEGIFGQMIVIEGQESSYSSYHLSIDYRGGRTKLKVRQNNNEIITAYDGPPFGSKDGKIDLLIHEGKKIKRSEPGWEDSDKELATKVQKIFDKYTRMISNVCPDDALTSLEHL
jgi:hypothetical protein